MWFQRLSLLGLVLAFEFSGLGLTSLQAQQAEDQDHDRPSPGAIRIVRFDDSELPPAPSVTLESPSSPSGDSSSDTVRKNARASESTEVFAIGTAVARSLAKPKSAQEETATQDDEEGSSVTEPMDELSSEAEASQDDSASQTSDDEVPDAAQGETPEVSGEAQESEGDSESSEAPAEAMPELNHDFLGEPVSSEAIDELRGQVRRTLMHYHQKPEAAANYSPWGIMHALIAYGADTEIIAGRRKVNAIGWLCWNGTCRGQQLLRAKGERVSAGVGVGLQGHQGQFLAMLAQSHVPMDFEIRVGEQSFTVADLIRTEQETCRPRTELTFKLIAFSHYLGSEATWKSDDGQQWDMSRLIREEIAQPVLGAACGGTHRLMGLSYAVAARQREGLPIDGEFRRAQVYVHDFQRHAMALRNRDGSFSTKWLERREAREDEQRRVQTTGHILEWLVFSLSEEQLRSPEIVRTVKYLSDLMWEGRTTDWEIGPKGHALHALNLYDQKVFGARIGQGGPRIEWH